MSGLNQYVVPTSICIDKTITTPPKLSFMDVFSALSKVVKVFHKGIEKMVQKRVQKVIQKGSKKWSKRMSRR